ncbi:MAG: potassium-transporting ATPase subunit KdpA [Rickettsiales bacterium]|jgi:K+-transporting ATPase ATPase A chain|nr:potassium-transporting ATPase subunit KdpA [Rickettsiales bacterium]
MIYAFFYIAFCLLVIAICIKPLGWYMARVYMRRDLILELPLGWIERGIYRLCGIRPDDEMDWKRYAISIVTLGLVGFILLYILLLGQHLLPLNPQNMPALSPDLAFNVAMSFITNTNWQSYGGETTLSYFSQMAGLTVQNFLSAATGMAVAVALCRGIGRKRSDTLGNAWVDVVRSILYILLPLSIIFALLLSSQGVIQNFTAYTPYTSLEGQEGVIAQGPVASQIAIKMLGSNGGGFFNVNAAHPFENPNAFTNLIQILSILLIPASFTYLFGVMVGDRRQGWVLFSAMTIIFVPLALLTAYGEQLPNPKIDTAMVDVSQGNMEGKEMRFGTASSAMWAVSTTATSNGSVNSMHGSYAPLSGLIPLLFIQFGEVVYGGVGSGLYGMAVYVLLTVFIGGLMVGRTPEYLGKKIGAFEIKMASLVVIIPASMVLVGTAIAISTEAGRAGILNPGAQGFSEVLYALSSASNNNGSAFAGLSANSPFYNVLLGVAMFVGRYWVIIPILALAGALASKSATPASAGTLPTTTLLFTTMLAGVVVLLDVLTYVPSWALGPLAEHVLLYGAAP